jgi:hypothetical protein
MQMQLNAVTKSKYGLMRFIIVVLLFTSLVIQYQCLSFPDFRPARAQTNITPLPFAPGERLRFALQWTVIPAGEAIMEIMPMKTIDGQKAYHFRLTAESNAFVDLFYKVRDRIDAYTSIDMAHTLFYQHKQHEGENRKNVEVNFNWDKKIAYFNDGRTKKEIELKPGTFDPLSVFYYARTMDFKTNKIIECPVSDGKKCVIGQARVIRKETIKIGSDAYETFLIEPDLKHVGGVFEKSKDAKIHLWITADEKHIPVKIASKVAIGSFIGELITSKTTTDKKKN